MDAVSLLYVGAGLALPMFYLPQIRLCLRDRSGLRAFSLGKSAVQFGLRVAMMPFVLQVGSPLMSAVVLLDLAARGLELAAALYSLRRQGLGWGGIAARCLAPARPWPGR
ncbi:MAG: hypothetical protein KBC73_10910 [Burkholderiaceae bacterium]|nr:hypothetical protein [Burkholderiaceae bacterium]